MTVRIEWTPSIPNQLARSQIIKWRFPLLPHPRNSGRTRTRKQFYEATLDISASGWGAKRRASVPERLQHLPTADKPHHAAARKSGCWWSAYYSENLQNLTRRHLRRG